MKHRFLAVVIATVACIRLFKRNTVSVHIGDIETVLYNGSPIDDRTVQTIQAGLSAFNFN